MNSWVIRDTNGELSNQLGYLKALEMASYGYACSMRCFDRSYDREFIEAVHDEYFDDFSDIINTLENIKEIQWAFIIYNALYYHLCVSKQAKFSGYEFKMLNRELKDSYKLHLLYILNKMEDDFYE